MDIWIDEVLRVLRRWAGQPASESEFWTMVAVGVLSAILIFSKVVKAMRAGAIVAGGRTIITILGSLVFVVVGAAAANLYLVPRVADPILLTGLPIACPVLAALILAIPISALLHRITYFEALFALVLSIAAAIVTGLLIHGAFEAGRAGFGEMLKSKEHNDVINSVL
jgi:hypothetical protein